MSRPYDLEAQDGRETPRADFARLTIGRMLSRDWTELEQCEMLTQCKAVDYLLSTYPKEIMYKGMAVRWLLNKAIENVTKQDRVLGKGQQGRIAQFLEKRRIGQSVASIAREWGISREYVSLTINRRAIELVAEQYLKLSRRRPDKPAA